MSEVFPFISILMVAILTISLINRKNKKKLPPPGRLPHRADTPLPRPHSPTSTTSRRLPTVVNTSGRKPRRADDREYMNYRNCPDCHSENEIDRQVIFKVAPHEFVCKVCGHKFKF